LNLGADIDEQNNKKQTALHLACKTEPWALLKEHYASNNANVITHLIERKANVNKQDQMGRTALHSATISSKYVNIDTTIQSSNILISEIVMV
jgi:ankyrin repeat protein